MGYYSLLKGSVSIEPPLLPKQFGSFGQDDHEVWICPDGERLELYRDDCKMYHLKDHLKALHKHVKDQGSELSGTLYRSGEENGDVERFRFSEGKMQVDQAKLIFPDGEEYNG